MASSSRQRVARAACSTCSSLTTPASSCLNARDELGVLTPVPVGLRRRAAKAGHDRVSSDAHRCPAPPIVHAHAARAAEVRRKRGQRMVRSSVRAWLWVLGFLGSVATTSMAGAATLPAGFAEVSIATGITRPTAMAFAPDGRLFVAEQGGRLRVIKNGTLLPTPFVDLTSVVDAVGERGLLGMAVDPNFAANHFLYVYYTVRAAPQHNQVVRYTASGDVALATSAVVILGLDNLTTATNHNGGAMHFGADCKLYIAVGANATPSNASSLPNRLGKILRINSNGSIPTDNPFFTTAAGANRAIWALGLRNPFTFAVQPGTGRIFINDVGQASWEEINEGAAGANYGWPTTEGRTTNTAFRAPLFTYGHGAGATTGCAITGGAFYNPPTTQFPAEYVGDYFFADYCSGWIRRYDRVSGVVTPFASGIGSPVNLKVGTDGSLYYLARMAGTGAVFRVSFTNSQAPSIATQPTSQGIPAGNPVTLTVAASGAPPLTYRWQRNGVTIAGATSSTLTIPSAAAADNGATFRAIVTNALGTATSNAAILTVTAANARPVATIAAPTTGTLYSGGNTISYSGSGTDRENGILPASAFTWQVDLHHDTHTHPFIPPTTGSKTGSFRIPTTGHTETNVFYRIHLTVKDSAGLTATTFVDLIPRKVTLTLSTNPAGLKVTLDGQPRTTPVSVPSVVGIARTLGAVLPQTVGSTIYGTATWSDGGAPQHTISTPTTSATYTATYRTAAANLIAAYSFSEGAGNVLHDVSGHGLTGTISGASWTTGRAGAGSALAFDGVNDWVTVPHSALLNFTTGMTLEAWVFPTRLSGTAKTIVVKERAGHPSVYALWAAWSAGQTPTGKVFVTTGANQRLLAPAKLALNGWTHVATTFDGRMLRFFVNGVEVTSRPVTGTILASTGPLRIGGSADFGEFFQGRIDDLRIYNRALTAAEVRTDMGSAVGVAAATAPAPARAATGTSSAALTATAMPAASRATAAANAMGPSTGTAWAVAAAGPGGIPWVRSFTGGGDTPAARFLAYESPFTGGVFVAVGDLAGVGNPQIVAGPGRGRRPEVRTFWPDGAPFGVTFLAYEPSFTGGVRVATCDVDGDGLAEIVTSPGPGRAPEVKIWKIEGGVARVLFSFLAADASATRGVFVACGDFDEDGRSDVVTSLDAGGAPDVRVWRLGAAATTEIARFVPYDPAFRGGVRVAVADVDGDGHVEIITSQGPGGTAEVRVFRMSGASVSGLVAFDATDADVTDGVFVAAGDIDGDGRTEIMAGLDAGVAVFRVTNGLAGRVNMLPPADAAAPSEVPVGASR